MQVVINISNELYEMILNIPNYISAIATQAVRDGTPLPKGHGRLIDADALIEKAPEIQEYLDVLTQTIIEEDKESEGEE